MEQKLTETVKKESVPSKRAGGKVAKKKAEGERVAGELIATSPWACATGVVDAFGQFSGGNLDLAKLSDLITDDMVAIRGGDLSRLEQMLYGQALGLQAMFVNSARRASVETNLKLYQTHMGWAMKAQAQSRATLQALVELKQPRSAVFVKQQNVGAQQQIAGGDINNGSSSREENAGASNNLLEVQHGEWLDNGTTSTAGRIDPHLETLGKKPRPKIRQRQSAR